MTPQVALEAARMPICITHKPGHMLITDVPEDAEVTMRPSTTAELDEGQAGSMLKMLDMLEDLDDVQDVHTNADISDDIMERLDRAG